MHEDLVGFYNAPISLAHFSITCLCSLFGSGSIKPGGIHLDIFRILYNGQYWRLFTSQIAFDRALGVPFGLYLLYQFRFTERWFGSKKYGSYMVLVLVLSIFFQFIILYFIPSIRFLNCGPYALLGANAIFYHLYVPKLKPQMYRILGINISDKTWTYILLLMLCFQNIQSFIPISSGMMIGLVYHWNILYINRFRLPGFLVFIFKMFSPIFTTSSSSQRHQQRLLRNQQREMYFRQMQQMQGNMRGNGNREQLIPGGGGFEQFQNANIGRPVMATPRVEISEESIEQLMTLGFERSQVIQALQQTNGNVEAAANRLLN